MANETQGAMEPTLPDPKPGATPLDNTTQATDAAPSLLGEGQTQQPPVTGAPDQYADFVMPEGVTADDGMKGEFGAIAKELNLTQEQAQKLVDFYAGKAAQAHQAPYQQWMEMQTKWRQEVEHDPEIGGAQLNQNLAQAKQAIEQLGGNPLRQALNATGAGNNPAIVKAFVKMGAMMAEGSFVKGNPNVEKTSRADKRYGGT
ncbi:MAG: hypothetical protein HQM01_08230 [Magnetococcales bacterium]|nr:hypothetical protein [Magnetococcales bacterium]